MHTGPDLVTPNTYSLACLQPQPIRYIIAAVPEWNQKDPHNLYLSDTLAMENVKTTQMLDLYEVGVHSVCVCTWDDTYHRHQQTGNSLVIPYVITLTIIADGPLSFFPFFLRMNLQFITQTLAGVMEGGRGVSGLQNGLSIEIDGDTQSVKLVEMMAIQYSIQIDVVLTNLTLWVFMHVLITNYCKLKLCCMYR
jgi:hypothetical protein